MLNGTNYKTLSPSPPRRDQMYFDTTTKSLALRVYASGKGTWVLQYRPKNVAGDRSKIGTKKAVLGDRKSMSLSDARIAARRLTSHMAAMLKALEREVRELRQTNETLRKASAYFAQAELDGPLKL